MEQTDRGLHTSDALTRLIAGNMQFLWHHRCHEVWAQEELSFWRLYFAPTYNHREIVTRIKTVLMDCKILSYAIYELTGEIDLLLRLWIPPSVTQLSFENALKRDRKSVV